MKEFYLYRLGGVKDPMVLCAFDCTAETGNVIVHSDKFHIIRVQNITPCLVNNPRTNK